MTVTFRAWSQGYKELQSEDSTLFRLDGYNKTRYSRRKKKEGLLELASREAHEKQEVYFATILNDDGSPYCAIESNVGYFGLNFLQSNYTHYLTFQYHSYPDYPGKLFLRGVFLFECKPGTTEKMRRIDCSYNLDGMSTTTNSLLFCLLITFNIPLKILSKSWELLVRILKNTFPSLQRNAIQAYKLFIFTKLGIINPKLLQLLF